MGYKLLFIAIIIAILAPSDSHAQDSALPEFVVASVSATCIDTTYRPTNHFTKVYPNRVQYIKDKLVYELDITIKLYGNEFYYYNPLAITCITPDKDSVTTIFNRDLFELSSDEFYDFQMIVETRKTGWAKITVSEWDEEYSEVYRSLDIVFRDNSVYLQ